MIAPLAACGALLRTAAIASAALLGGVLAAQASPAVVVVLPEPLAAPLVAALGAALPGVRVAAAEPQQVDAARSGAQVVCGATELQLWRWQQAGRLAPLGPLGTGLPPGCRAASGAFLLPWSLRYGVAAQASPLPAQTPQQPWTLESLALATELQGRLGLCRPSYDPAPWLAGMEHRLGRGERETAGYALWTTLDARIGRYPESWNDLLQRLATRELLAAVVPLPFADRLPAGCSLSALADGAPLARLGVAAMHGADEAAAIALVERICAAGSTPDFLAQAQLTGAAPGAGDLDGMRVTAWLDHFAARIEGKGAGVERTADQLDFVFGFLFVAALGVGLWVSRRRPQAPPAAP